MPFKVIANVEDYVYDDGEGDKDDVVAIVSAMLWANALDDVCLHC